MKLIAFTIVLDGWPQISWHLPIFNRLTIPWRWIIAEGAAMNVACTSWCAPQQPRLSRDGTTEYLSAIRGHPRVTVLQRASWNGKVEQCNACLAEITEPCILLQLDSDEVYTPDQMELMVAFFNSYNEIKCARVLARMFVGMNIVVTSINTWGNRDGEWLRLWRYEPGMRFARHEPPVLIGAESPSATREQTSEVGLVMDHYSYVFERQVAQKGNFYKYPSAVAHWRRLQQNTRWPVADLRQFLPWVGPGATADRLFK